MTECKIEEKFKSIVPVVLRHVLKEAFAVNVLRLIAARASFPLVIFPQMWRRQGSVL